MCSVSARPVMKMTGTLERPASRFRRRQVSKPSMPGMTASSRIMSGVIWSTIRMAAAPSSATITVIPAPSSASVRSRSVSGESSTTSATSRFFGSVIIRIQCLEGCHVLVEIETIDQAAHLRNELGMLRIVVADGIELDLDRLDIADLPEADQLFDMLHRRSESGLRLPAWRDDLVGVVFPFQLEELANGLQQTRDVDRLHQVAVMKWLGQRRAMGFERAGGYHQDARLMMSVCAQRLRDFPAVHLRHRDVEQEQVGPAVLRQREAASAIGRAQQ